MTHPNYMLNPGDMFSVDLDKVLYATGAPKRVPKSGKSSASGEATENAEEAEEATEAPAEAKANEAKVKEVAEAKEETSEVANGEEAAEAEAQEDEANETKSKKSESSSGEMTYSWQKDPNYPKEFDVTKQYRTPWLPRDYLSAWAFIPSYLEVNHNIGHAVYLRDPVAKPGLSEVSFETIGYLVAGTLC
jgi:ribosomal protein S4